MPSCINSPDSGRTYIVRMESPRFVVEMVEGDDGSWQAGEIRAIDLVSREDVNWLMSEAGGSIYLSDDYAGAIYQITRSAAGSAASTAAVSKPSGVRAAIRVEAEALPVSRGNLEIDPTVVARGRARFASHDCADPATSAGASVPLANIAERFDVDALPEFLAVPPPAMPTPELRAIERRALASFLLSRVEG